jgi:hypothetical protein
MSLWKSTDANTSAPKFVGVGGSSTQSGLTMYANTTTSAFITNQKVGVFGVDVTEQGLANNRTTHGAHAGWNLVKQGTGGRAGRIHTETLVAMGSMVNVAGGGSDGSASANDDTTFADA